MNTFLILLISVGLVWCIDPQPESEINFHSNLDFSKVLQSAVGGGVINIIPNATTTSNPLVIRKGVPIDLSQRIFYANDEDFQFHRKTLDLSGLDLNGGDVKDILHSMNTSLLSQIVRLDLSNNQVTGLPRQVWPLQLEYSLRELYLDHNRLDMYDPGNRRTTSFELLRLLSLKKLSLSHCGLASSVSSNMLEYPRVETLDLSGNRLVDLPDGLTALATLQHLDVSGNNIRYLGKHPLSSLLTLQTLNLSHNGLEKMWDDPFEQLYKLDSLHLDHNSLSEPPKLYQYTGSYQPTIRLYLAGNAFHCGCAFKEMLDNGRIILMDEADVWCVGSDGVEWLVNTTSAHQCSPHLEAVREKWSSVKEWARDNHPDWSTLYRSLGWVLFGITVGLVYAHRRAKKTLVSPVPYNILDSQARC